MLSFTIIKGVSSKEKYTDNGGFLIHCLAYSCSNAPLTTLYHGCLGGLLACAYDMGVCTSPVVFSRMHTLIFTTYLAQYTCTFMSKSKIMNERNDVVIEK